MLDQSANVFNYTIGTIQKRRNDFLQNNDCYIMTKQLNALFSGYILNWNEYGHHPCVGTEA